MNVEKIWSILMDNELTHPDGKDFFIETFSKYQNTKKIFSFKLNGPLGRGGKIWYDNGRIVVTYYSEDFSESRQDLLDKVTEELEKLNEPIK